jgi:hypothetical protein
MRYFFARWVEGTGVPEFDSDYLILRTRGGKFVTRGTVKQNYDNLRLPVDIQLRSEGDQGMATVTLDMPDASADFNIESTGKPIAVVIDPSYKLLRISPDLRVSSIARRGIEQFKEGNYGSRNSLGKLKTRPLKFVDLLPPWPVISNSEITTAIDNFKTRFRVTSPAWLSVWSNIKMGSA